MRRTVRCQAAILDGDRVALLRVNDLASGTTFWVFPGGGAEGDETPEETVRREVREETTLEVAVERFLFAAPEPPEGIYQELHTYLCRVESGVATPGVEPEVDTPEHTTIQEIGWFDLRTPGSWPGLIRDDSITAVLLQRLRECLGYAPAGVALSLVVLRCADIERAASFYRRLGLRFTRHRHGGGPEHYAAELPGCVFELYPGEGGTARVGFEVPSLEGALLTLKVEWPDALISPPKESPWGRRAVVVDPDGHRVELTETQRS